MYAWSPRGLNAFDRETGYLRQAAPASFRILRIARGSRAMHERKRATRSR
jgi:hypothetical protein